MVETDSSIWLPRLLAGFFKPLMHFSSQKLIPAEGRMLHYPTIRGYVPVLRGFGTKISRNGMYFPKNSSGPRSNFSYIMETLRFEITTSFLLVLRCKDFSEATSISWDWVSKSNKNLKIGS